MGERCPYKARVLGSNPSAATGGIMATTGKPGEVKKCNTCGSSARITANGFIRAHWDQNKSKVCYG